MNKATKSQKSDNKTAKIAGILGLLAVVILVILLLLRGCGSKDAELPVQPETGTGISYDSAAVVGGWDEADMDKICLLYTSYLIPKKYIVDYVLSTHYCVYRTKLKARI